MLPSPRCASGQLARFGLATTLLLAGLITLAGPAQAEAVSTMDARFGEGLYGSAAVWTGEAAYVFGGNDGQLPDIQADKIWRYDPAEDTVTEMDASLPSSRSEMAAVWTGEHAYLVGGFGCSSMDAQSMQGCTDILRYDPADDSLATMDASLPRGDQPAAVFTGEHVYIFSGNWETIHRYDPATDTLETLDATLDRSRAGASAVWTGDVALLIGGSTDTIARYDPSSGEIETVDARLPSPRNDTAALFTGQHVYVLGGSGSQGTHLDEIVRYDPGRDEIDVRATSFSVGRSSFPGVWTGSDAYVFGGEHPEGYTDRIFRYTPSNAAPTARFTVDVDGRDVHVNASASSDPEGSIDTYRWRWDPGSVTLSEPTANHTYDDPGEHTIELTVYDGDGASASTTHTVEIGNEDPIARVDAQVTNQTVQVDASNTTDADGHITRYAWDWGDGASSTGRTASHTYTNDEPHTITLQVEDDDGATNTTWLDVELSNQPPDPVLELSIDGRTLSADGRSSSDPGGYVTSYRWEWGDGNDTWSPQTRHTYDAPGTYTVTLTVQDEDGARARGTEQIEIVNQAPTAEPEIEVRNHTVHTEAANATDPDGEIVAYAWDWGDGASSDGASASHTYDGPGERTVTLTLTDDDGATSTFTRVAAAENHQPVPRFDIAVHGAKVRVDADASSDPDGTVQAYTWDFGDGTTSDEGPVTTHAYDAGGTYTIELTVVDDGGREASTREQVRVSADPTAPLARVSLSTDGLTVSADGSGSSDPDGSIVSYEWRWGDGDTSSGARSAHTYDEPGRYTISLRVVDGDGAADQIVRTVTIELDDAGTDGDTGFTRERGQGDPGSGSGLDAHTQGTASHGPDDTSGSDMDDGEGGAGATAARQDETYVEGGEGGPGGANEAPLGLLVVLAGLLGAALLAARRRVSR